ncbi:MAG: hypothetical protein AB6733_12235 [Clostridiaceae bacterium]
MKQVIIDRGIYKLGRKNSTTGESTEPNWKSDLEGNCLIIGHDGEEFEISNVKDVEFLLKELSERLKLDFVSKVVPESFNEENLYSCSRCGEVLNNQDEDPEDLHKFCHSCGAVLDWSGIVNGED